VGPTAILDVVEREKSLPPTIQPAITLQTEGYPGLQFESKVLEKGGEDTCYHLCTTWLKYLALSFSHETGTSLSHLSNYINSYWLLTSHVGLVNSSLILPTTMDSYYPIRIYKFNEV
jgi:hypothetical protein